MGVAPVKIIFVVILSFAVVLVSSPNIIIVTKEGEQANVRKKFVILQSIQIIVIKSSETRAIIYTCRYSSGHF